MRGPADRDGCLDEVARWTRRQCRAGTMVRKEMAAGALPDKHEWVWRALGKKAKNFTQRSQRTQRTQRRGEDELEAFYVRCGGDRGAGGNAYEVARAGIVGVGKAAALRASGQASRRTPKKPDGGGGV